MGRRRDAKNRSTSPSDRPSRKIGEVKISTLSLSDLARVCEIEKLCFTYPWSRESMKDVLSDSASFSTLSVRTPDGGVVAYIIFAEVVDELHVLNVAVHPDFRKLGLATFMLMTLHRSALKKGRSHAFLEVRETNTAAQKLYAKFGYKPSGRRKDYYSDNHEDAILMVAQLSPAG